MAGFVSLCQQLGLTVPEDDGAVCIALTAARVNLRINNPGAGGIISRREKLAALLWGRAALLERADAPSALQSLSRASLQLLSGLFLSHPVSVIADPAVATQIVQGLDRVGAGPGCGFGFLCSA